MSHQPSFCILDTSVIPAKAGIQPKNIPRSDKYFVPLRGAFSINWIPAFAGMTKLKE
jgi:hypothetical protein